MEYRIRVYAEENIYDFPLSGKEQLSIGAGTADDCRIEMGNIRERHVFFFKRNASWFVNSADKALIAKERYIQEGDIFILDKERNVAVCVLEEHAELTQKCKLRGHTQMILGRGKGCGMMLPGSNISRQHAIISNKDNGWWIADNNSRNGTFLNQEKLTQERQLRDGDVISIGDYNILYQNEFLMIGDHEETGTFEEKKEMPYPHLFSRSPRLLRELPTETIEIQNPPMETSKPESDWLSILASPVGMIISLGLMAAITAASRGSMIVFTLPMAILQIFHSIIGHKKQKKKYQENEQKRLTKYGAYLDEIERKIQSLKRKQVVAMHEANPSLEDCLTIVETRDMRLWNRRGTDEDFMRLRLGLGEQAVSFQVKGQQNGFTIEEDALLKRAEKIVEDGQSVRNVPILCNLNKDKLLGIVGDRKSAVRLVKNLVMQTAVQYSYEDIKIVSVFARQEEEDFDWIKWLPHSFDEERRTRHIADSARSTDAVMRSFEEVLKQRSMDASENMAFSPFYLFVLTESEYMEDQAVLKYLLQDRKNLGIGVIFAFDKIELLPKECNAIIEMSGKEGRYYHRNNIGRKEKFTLESIGAGKYEKLSRSMAPIRLKGGAADIALPKSVTFMEGYGVKSAEELDAGRRWASGRTYESMAVPIGVKANGEAFLFDIHEKKYGPHGMVAGMTGSGKSEMVQSWILSMALKFSPRDVSFVLIDFKGTGLLLPFSNLPHLAGKISDLDTKIQRNLIALEKELSRRKELLDTYGVNNINNYLKLYQEGKTKEPLSFLFVIIDEFAEFKVQYPDFMTVVNRIFAIGRTLGVFMILLTQKPAGVVDDKMNANTRFRWCLKVASSADSKEMLHHSDAAKITVPGRAYVQVGEDEVYELIQSYYSGAPYRPGMQDKPMELQKVYEVNRQGRRTCYENEAVEQAMKGGETEISQIVDYLADFAKNSTDYEEAVKIWMPKLPGEIYLDDIAEEFSFKGGAWGENRPRGLKAPAGMIDAPAMQRQYPLLFDFSQDGHIAIFGAPGTGKTTLLQTAIMSLLLHYTPEEVNLYLMDFGGWSLGIFKNFPHVGGVANDNDDVRLQKLVQMLERKLLERKMKFSEIGVGSLQAYQEAAGEKLPYIVLALDNFAPVLQLYPDMDSFFIQLTREGGNYGIYFLVTANTPMALGFKVSQNMKMAVALQMTDKSDYQGIVGKTDGLEPENMEGRGLVKGSPPLEFQAALPANGKSESERVSKIRKRAEQMKMVWKGNGASPIPIMPESIPFGSVSGRGIALGLSSQLVEGVFLPEKRAHYMAVVGTGGSGKTNMLTLLARQALLEEESRVVMLSQSKCEGTWAENKRFRPITEAADFDTCIEELVPFLQKRKERHDAGEEVFKPVYILIDDYKKAHEEMGEKTAARLSAIIRLGVGLNVHLYLAEEADTFCRLCEQGEEVCMLMAKENSGILLGGSFHSYSVFSGDLSLTEKSQALAEYEGYLLEKGKITRFKAMKASET